MGKTAIFFVGMPTVYLQLFINLWVFFEMITWSFGLPKFNDIKTYYDTNKGVRTTVPIGFCARPFYVKTFIGNCRIFSVFFRDCFANSRCFCVFSMVLLISAVECCRSHAFHFKINAAKRVQIWSGIPSDRIKFSLRPWCNVTRGIFICHFPYLFLCTVQIGAKQYNDRKHLQLTFYLMIAKSERASQWWHSKRHLSLCALGFAKLLRAPDSGTDWNGTSKITSSLHSDSWYNL